MKRSGLKTIGAFAFVAALPLTAQASLERISDADLSEIRGQLSVAGIAGVNEATVPLSTGTPLGISTLAGKLSLRFPSRTWKLIARTEAGRTRMRRDAIKVRNGVFVQNPSYLQALEASFLLNAGRDNGFPL